MQVEPSTRFANRALDSGELFLRRRTLFGTPKRQAVGSNPAGCAKTTEKPPIPSQRAANSPPLRNRGFFYFGVSAEPVPLLIFSKSH